MPVFEQAQTEFPDVAFVLVNQGESAQQAQDYLDSEGLNLTDVLLDPASEAMRTMRSRGLPTTLFFDAQGRSEEHTSELQSLMRISYAVFCLKKTKYLRQHIILPNIR